MATFSPPRSPRSINKEPPFLIRTLAVVLRLFAVVLLLTTIYLFHLHHSNPHTADEAFDVDNYESGKANSVDGSAVRHKMELANFLIQKYDTQQVMIEDQKEAMELGGYKGGNESDFILMETKESDVSLDHYVNSNDSITNSTISKSTTMNQQQINHATIENGNNDALSILSNPITMSQQEEQHSDRSTNITNLSWQQLQIELLLKELLPSPIPPEHTARGFSGIHPDLSPALIGAKRGSIHCPDMVPEVESVLSSMLAYWNDPVGTRDYNAGSPSDPHVFIPPPLSREAAKNPRVTRRRYLTFEADTGGWNNLRISLENIIVLAAISGRTLVLPPDHLLYLLSPGKADDHKERNYNNYINFDTDLLRRVPIITAEQFLQLEGGEDGLAPLVQYNATWQDHLWKVSRTCVERKLSDVFCEDLYDHYLQYGQLSDVTSEWPNESCFIFDEGVFLHGNEALTKLGPEMEERIKTFCRNRKPIFYNQTMHEADIWHFETWQIHRRLLAHFYAMIFFTDPKIGNFYKRFVRDNFRYHDKIYCAAGKIILALQYEDKLLSENGGTPTSSLELDAELVGGYSSLHIRRGDLQFKEVKFDSEQWYQNTKEIWKPNEVLYIATDETNETFFDDFRMHHAGPMRFLDDYMQLAGLDEIDPTLYGMIDTIVASRGSMFAGTWFSTFTGYIVRLRGYYGMSKFFSYYSWLDRKYYMHKWMNVGDVASFYSREFPTGWTGIDGDVFVDNDNEGRESEYGMSRPRGEMDRLKVESAASWLDKPPSFDILSDGNLTRGTSRRLTELTLSN